MNSSQTTSLTFTKTLPLALAAIAFVLAVIAPTASAQATRTWVSGTGDDVNPCSRTAPCKTFAGAISKTAEGGEINAIDSGGYGAVTISKAITIDGLGAQSSILNSGANGVIVNAGADDDVILRNLEIVGSGVAAACPWTGLSGIRVLAARTLRVENVTINNQSIGVEVVASGTNPDIFFDILLNNVNISNTCNYGIKSVPAAGHPVRMALNNNTISNANTAFHAAAGTEAWVTGSNFFLNNLGLDTSEGGLIHSLGGNQVVGNATNGAFTDLVDGDPSSPPAAPSPPATATTYCVVPKLKGKTRAAASASLTAGNCALGNVRSVKVSRKSQRKKVLSQTVPAGVEAKAGTKVGVLIGK
ncbi:MAG: hypothetical protein HY827_03730 [Actinobacteria bacterium]|nr:hypothetical protein [Actinomycetota bacterium]